MDLIQTPSFKAKNNKEYFFKLNIESDESKDSDYYYINVFDSESNQVGSLTLSNLIKEKYDSIYNDNKLGDILFIEERQIANTGLFINDNGELKISNKDYFISFYEDFLFLENIRIKNEDSLNEFLSELNDFLIPEKEIVLRKINKPEIISVYVDQGQDGTEDLRGLGIGKKMYTYASQWMGANNMKVHTQNLRTKDAVNLWENLKNDPSFHFTKNEGGADSIYRTDGIVNKISVNDILNNKIQKTQQNTKLSKPQY